MALTFTTDLDESILLNAYTNNVVEFESDNASDAFKCIISVGGYTFERTPNQNKFNFNFKTVFKRLILDYFEDAPTVELDADDPTSFIKDMSSVYKAVTIDYLVSFLDGSTESHQHNIHLLQSTSNFQDRKKREIQSTDSFAVLGKLEEGSNRTFHMTYFEGYPFDIQVYKKNAGNVKITNKTVGLHYTFNLPHKVNRIFFSDTFTDSTIEDILPIVTGTNQLEFDTGELTTIYLEKKTGLCGNYLKWKNHEGGWSYFLFNQRSRTTRGVDDLGYINNDYQNLDNNNFIKNIGKSSTDRMAIGAINVPNEKRRFLESLFDSPKVYLFTGRSFSKDEPTDWLSVRVLTNDFVVNDYSQRPFDVNMVIELPERNTLTL